MKNTNFVVSFFACRSFYLLKRVSATHLISFLSLIYLNLKTFKLKLLSIIYLQNKKKNQFQFFLSYPSLGTNLNKKIHLTSLTHNIHGISRKGFGRCRLICLLHYIQLLFIPLHTNSWEPFSWIPLYRLPCFTYIFGQKNPKYLNY